MNLLATLITRAKGKYRRTAASVFARRNISLANKTPIISFTFDDFPQSALYNGGQILKRYNLSGTYYTSLGLMGQVAPTGQIFYKDDITQLLDKKHELGCHTFSHCHASDTRPSSFEESVIENSNRLKTLAPQASFSTLSYPIGSPRPGTKRLCARHFMACRGGGQTFNYGRTDLNNLKAFFIEQSRDQTEKIDLIIEQNAEFGGWLIFATHDVTENPTRYGCTPAVFEHVVTSAVKSGASILNVSEGLRAVSLNRSAINTRHSSKARPS